MSRRRRAALSPRGLRDPEAFSRRRRGRWTGLRMGLPVLETENRPIPRSGGSGRSLSPTDIVTGIRWQSGQLSNKSSAQPVLFTARTWSTFNVGGQTATAYRRFASFARLAVENVAAAPRATFTNAHHRNPGSELPLATAQGRGALPLQNPRPQRSTGSVSSPSPIDTRAGCRYKYIELRSIVERSIEKLSIERRTIE
jgi:hypothetical protein